MAKTFVIFSLLFLLSSFITGGTNAHTKNKFSKKLPPSSLSFGLLLKRVKLAHLHFYLHDTIRGQNPTTVRVAEAATTNSSPSGFGAVAMADIPMTVGLRNNSRLVGRAQGMYAFSSQSEMAVIMMINFTFRAKKYNGSTITVMGRNVVLEAVREMPIIGGTGVFRFARGYVQLRSISDDANTGNNVVEYNVYVLHY